MNGLNSAVTRVFDVLLAPLEWVGERTALVVASGLFGVAALYLFKKISWQAGIKSAKDRIKGHMIEIRLYQDDLRVVGAAVGKVLWRNFQYLGLNFGPFVPLAIPFVFVAAQFVVRYAYDPLPVAAAGAKFLPGQGTLLEIELVPERRADVAHLRVALPSGLAALSPLVRAPSEGRAFQEIAATSAGVHEIVLELPGGVRETKLVVAGTEQVAPRVMQPRRVSSRDWLSLDDPDHWPALWPAEAAFAKDSPFRSIAIAYPARDQGWLPEGEIGILATFVLASMAFGFLALKPMGVQI